MQALVIRTFKSEMQRPSPAKEWQMPQDTAEPICPFCAFRSTPLEVQATSYFAASERILSLSNKSMRKASFTIFTISQNICSCKEVFSFYFLKLLPKRINLPRRKLLGKALLYQNQGFQVGSDLVQHCSGLKFLTGLGKRSGLIKFSHFR